MTNKMSNERCLYCYQKISDGTTGFHPKCSKKIFGTSKPPVLDYSRNEMLKLGEKVIKEQTAVTGVQAKLSLGLKKSTKIESPKKLTIMGVWGEYILKPPSDFYNNLPELEDLTMHLAQIAGIKTVPHTLIRLKSGELSYLTKRIDRKKKQKFHMEDMCQLTGKLTESKYRGSYEQIGKAIVLYSEFPMLDIINFFEEVLFCFLTGNNDMHLKNFSLFKDPVSGYRLSPAYDLIASELVVEGDDEELALTLNGKKNKIKKSDFENATNLFKIDKNAVENIFKRFKKVIPQWYQFIDISFLPESLKKRYKHMIDKKMKQIEL
jgi:serine/threonine-protein kinase HipA